MQHVDYQYQVESDPFEPRRNPPIWITTGHLREALVRADWRSNDSETASLGVRREAPTENMERMSGQTERLSRRPSAVRSSSQVERPRWRSWRAQELMPERAVSFLLSSRCRVVCSFDEVACWMLVVVFYAKTAGEYGGPFVNKSADQGCWVLDQMYSVLIPAGAPRGLGAGPQGSSQHRRLHCEELHGGLFRWPSCGFWAVEESWRLWLKAVWWRVSWELWRSRTLSASLVTRGCLSSLRLRKFFSESWNAPGPRVLRHFSRTR